MAPAVIIRARTAKSFKLKLQYFGHLMQRNDSFEKTLMLGKTEGRRRRGRQRMRWYQARRLEWVAISFSRGSS